MSNSRWVQDSYVWNAGACGKLRMVKDGWEIVSVGKKELAVGSEEELKSRGWSIYYWSDGQQSEPSAVSEIKRHADMGLELELVSSHVMSNERRIERLESRISRLTAMLDRQSESLATIMDAVGYRVGSK